MTKRSCKHLTGRSAPLDRINLIMQRMTPTFCGTFYMRRWLKQWVLCVSLRPLWETFSRHGVRGRIKSPIAWNSRILTPSKVTWNISKSSWTFTMRQTSTTKSKLCSRNFSPYVSLLLRKWTSARTSCFQTTRFWFYQGSSQKQLPNWTKSSVSTRLKARSRSSALKSSNASQTAWRDSLKKSLRCWARATGKASRKAAVATIRIGRRSRPRSAKHRRTRSSTTTARSTTSRATLASSAMRRKPCGT